MTLNITLTDEQVFSLIEQLPKERKAELLNHLQFDEWLDTPKAIKLKEDSEKDVNEGRITSLDNVREKMKVNEKNI